MITLELWSDYRSFVNLQLTGQPTPMLVQFDPFIRYSVYVGRIADPARASSTRPGCSASRAATSTRPAPHAPTCRAWATSRWPSRSSASTRSC